MLATAPAADGGCAALLPWDGGTVLGRLLGQLAGLGVADVRVLTRPAWDGRVREAAAGRAVSACAGAGGDLRAIAGAAGGAGGAIVVVAGDVVTQREALAGAARRPARRHGRADRRPLARAAFRLPRCRSRRGRIVSAASPYHAVHRPTAWFLGVLKVAAADRPALAAPPSELAELAADPPAEWRAELERKAATWRTRAVARSAAAPVDEGGRTPTRSRDDLDDDELSAGRPGGPSPCRRSSCRADDEAGSAQRLAAAPEDAVLARARRARALRRRTSASATCASCSGRGRSRPSAAGRGRGDDPRLRRGPGAARLGGQGERRLLHDVLRQPVLEVHRALGGAARHDARTRSRPSRSRIGVLAAAAFATGERWGLVAGAVLLQVAFTTDCVDGQLARYTRTFSKLGAWLDSIFDRAKEYVVFAGLAIGASRAGDPVWVLAGAALTLQTVRHVSTSPSPIARRRRAAPGQPPLERSRDAAGQAAAEPPSGSPRQPRGRRGGRRRRGSCSAAGARSTARPACSWVKKMIAFPIGERFAVISITAAIFDARARRSSCCSCGAASRSSTRWPAAC